MILKLKRVNCGMDLVVSIARVIHVGHLTFDKVGFLSQLCAFVMRAPDNNKIKQ